VVLGIFIEQMGGNDRLDDVFQNAGAKLFVGDVFGVLGGNYHGIDAQHIPLCVIFDRNLGLPIGTQIRQSSILADL
jgi:hypothetical protein